MYFEEQSQKFGADLERVQVWDALSEFYLDTYHTEEELERMGERLSTTRFSVEEMRHIALFEVTPVCVSNLFCLPGGEWAGFALDWLIPQCMVQQQKHPFSNTASNKTPIGIRLLMPFCKDCYSRSIESIVSESRHQNVADPDLFIKIRHSSLVSVCAPLVLLLLLFVQTAVASDVPALPSGVTTDHPIMYRVRQRTKVVAPWRGRTCNRIRVYHALPNTRPWSRVTTNVGITALSYVPKTGKIEVGDMEGSGHIVFSNSNIRPGTQLVCESDFQVVSVNRTFNPHSRTIFWNQYTKEDQELGEETDEIHPTLVNVGNELKRDNQPIAYVQKASEWVRENIKYDSTVGYGNEETDQIMAQRRGHCGHAQNIFKQLMAQAKIPYKTMYGLNLVDRNGGLNEDRIRQDYSNNHMWAAVYFPSIGWVEVDTFQGAKCFFIPACMIQNNAGFQNYSVWVDEDGEESRMPSWSLVNGKFVSDYGVDNTITFSEQGM